MKAIIESFLDKITEKNNLVRITGLFGIFGMFLVFLTDYKILYLPLSAKEYTTFRSALAHSSSDIFFYSRLAVFAVPFVILGLYHFYLTLAKANKLLARVAVGIYVFAYLNSAFYYAFLAYVMNAAKVLVPHELTLSYFMRHIYFLLQLHYYFGIIAGSILLFLGITFFKGKNYPNWYIYVNPLYLIFVFRIVLPLATPPVYSGFFLNVSFNLVMLITMMLSTFFMWKKSWQDIMPDIVK